MFLSVVRFPFPFQGFRPNMYRLMQMSGSPLRQGYMYNHVFEQETNRVQLISDFPRGNEAEMIASLEVFYIFVLLYSRWQISFISWMAT